MTTSPFLTTDPTALLRPYQRAAFTHLTQALSQSPRKFVLDGSETGLGKTFTALSIASWLKLPVGVVSPANACTKWLATCRDSFQLEPTFVSSWEKLRNGSTPYVTRTGRGGRLSGQGDYAWQLRGSFIIFDEVHMAGGRNSLNAKLLKAAIDEPTLYCIGLSATAFHNPLYMRALGYGLGLHNWRGYADWLLRNGVDINEFGGYEFDGSPGSVGARALARMHERIFPRSGYRLRRQDLADQLPPSTIIVDRVDVPAPPKRVQEALAALQDHVEAKEDQAELEERQVADAAYHIWRRREAELLKAPLLVERALAAVEQGMSVPIFCNFTATRELLAQWLSEELGYRVSAIYGGQSPAQRDEELLYFQRNASRVLVAQSDAGSASIDMHDTEGGHPRLTLCCPTYRPLTLIQMLGRVDRDGAKTPSTQYLLYAAGTVEDQMARAVQVKLDNLATLNDGDLNHDLRLVNLV